MVEKARLKIKINPEGLHALLTSDELQDDLIRRAKAISDACNEQSTWGGYAHTRKSKSKKKRTRARARAWSYGAHDDESREQRLVKNLDKGRE